MSELPIQQGGLRVLSGIVPASSASTYGTHYSYLGVGGYVEVPNIDYRNSIPPDSNMNDEGYSTGRRRYGMMVYVIDEDKLYRLFPFSGGSVVSMETFTGTSELNQVTMLSNNNGWIEVPDLSVLITGGTYFSGNSSIVLYDSTGGTVSITGITTTDIINPGDGRVLVSTGNSENIFVAQSNMVFNGTNLNITGGTFITDSGGSLHSSAIIQFKSTTKGVLLPGMTTSQKNAIVNPTTGLTVYDSTIEDISVYTSSGWTGVIAERDNLQKVTERGNSTNTGLRISGTTNIVGSGSTSGSTAFSVQNSTGGTLLNLFNNGNLNIDNGSLYVDGDNGRVGIGTTTPETALHLYNSANVDVAATIESINARSPYLLIKHPSRRYRLGANISVASAFEIYDENAASSRFIINTNGNVTINTTTDAGYKLDVNGTTRVNNTLRVVGSVGYGSNVFEFGVNGGTGQNGYIDGFGRWFISNGGTNTRAATIGSDILFLGQQTASPAIQLSNPNNVIGQWSGIPGTYNNTTTSETIIVVNNQASANLYGMTIAGDQSSGQLSSKNLLTLSHWGNSGVQTFGSTSASQFYNLINVNISVVPTQPNKTLRGFYYNPTISGTTLANHNAIEVVTGNVLLGTTSGNVGIGTSTLGTSTELTIGGSQTASSAIARGGLLNTSLSASSNNDVLVGLDINPTFTNGAFTGVTNWGIRNYSSFRFETASDLSHGLYWSIANDGTQLKIFGSSYSGGMGYLQLNVLSGSDGMVVNGSSRNLTIKAAGSELNITPSNTIFNQNGTGESMRIVSSTKNVLIGTTTDAGFKLDVNGSANFSNNVVVTTASSGTVQLGNSTTSIFRIVNTYERINVQPISIGGTINLNAGTEAGASYTLNDSGHVFAYPFNRTTANTFSINRPFFGNVVAGTKTMLSITTSNVSALSNATLLRGIYFNPTVTDWASVIAFENTAGNVILGSTSGNVMIGTSTDAGYRLDVSGTTRIISTGSTSGSTTLTLQNSTGRTTTEFRSDGVIGISSASTFTTQVTSVISASTTNSGIAIVPNGTGAFTLSIPDGTDTGGGNARGQYAVDLKLGGRTAATQVASGNYSAVIGGDVSTASGVKSLAGGSAFATGTNSVALGGSSFATGSGSVAIGGEQGGGLGATASGRAAVAFGLANAATADFSNSLGGLSNSVSGPYSSVVGGWLNINGGSSYASIVGGRSNVLSTGSWYSFIGGGWNNGVINGDYSVVVGGFSNSATTQYAAVIGGSTNRSTGLYSLTHGLGNIASSTGSTSIGFYNTASGTYSVVLGSGNTSNSNHTSILGGVNNNIYAQSATIVGGSSNLTGSYLSFIGGGTGNYIANNSNTNYGYSSIVGGASNKIGDDDFPYRGSFIGGGLENKINATRSFIGSGYLNRILTSSASFIGGGESNTVNTNYSVIVGGQSNTISTNAYATIVGGLSNTASGTYSIAGGHTSIASGDWSTAFGDSNATGTGSFAAGTSATASGSRSISIGQSTTASGSNSIALGLYAAAASTGSFSVGEETYSESVYGISFGYQSHTRLRAQQALSSGNFGSEGSAQQSLLTSRAVSATTSGSTITLSLDGTGVTNLITPYGNNRAWNVVVNTITVCTVVSGGTLTVGDAHAGEYKFLFKRVGGTSTISPITTSSEVADTSMATASFSFSAGTSQQMAITFNAPNTANNSTFRAVAKVALTEVAW
jgi:trimeric autotransporter adhesin